MSSWKKRAACIALSVILLAVTACAAFFVRYRRPAKKIVDKYSACPALAFAIIKAESGFSSNAKSNAGAVGLMQLVPSTAEFICKRENIPFEIERLTEKNYNAMLGCLYLNYLLSRFSIKQTAVAAYNAGEGTVSVWLSKSEYSPDGVRLAVIPYSETSAYVKKVMKFEKIYAIFNDKT